MDAALAIHFAHMYIYEPLYVYASKVEDFEPEDLVHFEIVQSTVYPSVRFKPPPTVQDKKQAEG